MAQIVLTASMENLETAIEFVKEQLAQVSCSTKTMRQVVVAVEEIFVNITSYAYNPDYGPVIIQCEVDGDPLQLCIGFQDQGRPYDPLAKEDPDITLKAKDRSIGGLGIFMTKRLMTDIQYEFRDGKNVLKIKKTL